MFSGIVEECARVTGIVKEQENVHFVQCSFVHNEICYRYSYRFGFNYCRRF